MPRRPPTPQRLPLRDAALRRAAYWRPRRASMRALPPTPASRRCRPRSPRPSSTSQADTDALENVIELVRKHKPADARRRRPRYRDPVARKLAEWLILRSDDNGASVERYRAFLSANPSWPSQTFLRRRIEAALWDDRRDDATVWAWFENECRSRPRASSRWRKALLARGDRANAERLVRERLAQRCDVRGYRERGARHVRRADHAGDHKARMDLLLYGSEHEAAHARRQAARRGHVALAKARIAANKKAANAKALLDAVPRELHSDPGYMFAQNPVAAPRGEVRRGRPADAGARRRIPDRLHNLDEWWIERRLLARKLLDVGEHRTAYLIARDAALPATRHLQDRAGIHRRLDRAAVPERSGDRRAAFCAHRRRQRQSDRAGARRLLAGPRRRSRRPRPGSARGLQPRPPSNRPAITASWRAPSSACRSSS